ncbi:hypothetical protein MXB_1244 [Myxobolus squamalis]|nr:hypothetical protein MXB_1244 [Myxobolus squamalis]
MPVRKLSAYDAPFVNEIINDPITHTLVIRKLYGCILRPKCSLNSTKNQLVTKIYESHIKSQK